MWLALVGAALSPIDTWGQTADTSLADHSPVEGIVRIDVGGVTTADLVVLFAGDSLYLPLVHTATLLGLEIGEPADGATSLSVDGGNVLLFDSLHLQRTTHSGTTDLSARYRRHDMASWIEWHALCDFLEVRGVFDFDQLFLRLAADDNIPVVAWSRREQIATIGEFTASTTGIASDGRYYRSLIGLPEVYWRLSHDAYYSNRGELTSTAGGVLATSGPFLMGQLDLGITARSPLQGERDLAWNLTHARWTYSQPHGTLLTSIGVGSIFTAGRPAFGLSLTNRTLLPRRHLTLATYHGIALPGSEVWLMRGRSTTIRTVADATGHYSFDVPVGYGTTSAIIRSDQVGGGSIERSVVWTPAVGLLPSGTFEYTLGAGRTRDGSDDIVGGLEIRGGVSSRWTVDGSVSGIIRSSDNIKSSPEVDAAVGITGWLGRSSALRGEVNLRSGALRGGLQLGSPSDPGLRIVVDSIHLGGRSDISASARLPIGPVRIDAGSGVRRESNGDVQIAPFGTVRAGLGNTSLALSASVPRGYSGNENRRLSIGADLYSWALPRLPIGAGVRWYPGSSTGSEYYVLGSAHLGRGTRIGLQATLPFDSPEDGRYSLRVEVPVGNVRPVVRGTIGNGATSLSTTVEGTTIATPLGVRMLPLGIRGGCSLLLTGFEDRNRNGVRDADEPSLGLLDGNLYSEGIPTEFVDGRIEGFAPFRRVTLEIDRFSRAVEGLYPLRQLYEITTGPSSQIHIDVPFAPGVEIFGEVAVEGREGQAADPLLAALTAWLTGENGSRFQGEVFSDGTIYFAGVPEGRYHLIFDDRQLRTRGLCFSEDSEVVVIAADTHQIPKTLLTRCVSR